VIEMRVLVDIAATIRMAGSADAVAFLRFAVERVKEFVDSMPPVTSDA
jgi:hypothetical protein